MRIVPTSTRRLALALVIASLASLPLHAALPDAVPYQGRVAVDGTNFTGTGQFKFAIYEHASGNFTPAIATATISGGSLTIVTVTAAGSGYSAGATVSFTGGGGSGATATASVVGGSIAAITVTNPGSGYTAAPTVVISDSAAPAQLWNNAAGATTGALAEPATAVALPVTNGLYAAGLGDTALANMAALPASLAPAAGKRTFVRIWFDDGSHGFQQLTPDTELRSVPFAREALTAQNASSIAGVSPANIPQLDAANTFTHVNGLTVTSTGPSGGNPATGATVPVTGAGTRMEFLPGYSAFRAGTVTGTQWDAANVGIYSTASGINTTASGSASTALGSGTTASGWASTSLGTGTAASGSGSTALGYGTTASGGASTSLGYDTKASGEFATALGSGTTASGDSSTASGYSTKASGAFSTALGSGSTASGYASTALGISTAASGDSSTALGIGTTASGDYSTALGSGTTAESGYETVLGRYNTDYTPASASGWYTTDRLFVIGNGTGNYARSDALIVFKNGNATLKGTLTQGSDRNRKHDIVPADTAAVLAGVVALPVSTWKYKDETTTHLGPMAQDFAAAFHLGADETGIASVDADGVALASIQELAKQNAALKSEVSALQTRLAALEAKLK